MEPDPAETEPAPPPPGPSLLPIPGHRVLEEIARGGMGIVYRARQLEPRRTVALKMLLPQQMGSEEMRQRFRLEARAIASLDHPAILPVYQVGELDGLPFFTMKFAAGGSLAARGPGYRGQFRRIATLVAALAEAVQFAHAHGILHRDLKPGNILFDDAGQPYISDFGLAKFLDTDAALTPSLHCLGTPNYMAPEIAARGVSAATTASDLYSLGAILYELLAGRPPFDAPAIPVLLKMIAEQEPTPPAAVQSQSQTSPDEGQPQPAARHTLQCGPVRAGETTVPRDLQTICLKCLAKAPALRYGSARELADDLRRWLAGQPIVAHPLSRRLRLVRWARRNPTIALLALLLALALAGGGLALARSNHLLRDALLDSLLTQARLERSSGRVGQRFRALALIERAAPLLPPSRWPDDPRRLALRSEAAGALALPDFRRLASWPLPAGSAKAAVEFSHDLAQYVTTTPDGGYGLFATSDHRLLRHFQAPTNNPPLRFKLSGDGQWLAASFLDGHAEVQSLTSTQLHRAFPGQPAVPTEVEFLPGTSRVLVAGGRQGLLLLNLADGTRRTLPASPATLTALSAAPDGTRLACAAFHRVLVLRLTDGATTCSLPLTNGLVTPAWSPDGRYLAIADSSQPYETTVFDLNSGQVVGHFQDHEQRVVRLVFHPDGRSILSVGLDNRLVWRQLAQGGPRVVAEAGWRVLRLSDDGHRLACEAVAGQVDLLQVISSPVFREWRRATPPNEAAAMLQVRPDGRLVATASEAGLHLWDAPTRSEIAPVPLALPGDFPLPGFTPEGRWGGTFHPILPEVWIWDAPTGRRPEALQPAQVRPSPDGRWLVVSTSGQHQLWETGSWKPGPAWGHPPQEGDWPVAFSPDGRWMAIGTSEGRVEIRALPTARLCLDLPPPQPMRLRGLSFDPGSRRLYLLQATGRLCEWNLASLRSQLAARRLDWAE